MTGDTQLTTRLAGTEDAALIRRMILALADTVGGRPKVCSTVQDFERALSGNAPAIHAIVAEQQDTAVGLAVFFPTFSTWRGSQGVYLQDIYVADDLRGSGVGRVLLQSVMDWASRRGATHLRLSVDRDNVSAQTFYESLGLGWREDEKIYEIAGDAFGKAVTTS